MTAELIIALMGAIFASSGLWTVVLYKIQQKDRSKDALTRLMLGLAHDRFMEQALKFEEQGYVSEDEYSDFKKYLYDPYIELGGDGTAERVYETKIKNLPIKIKKEM